MKSLANLKTWVVISLFLLSIVSTTVFADTIYVKEGASGAGTSWTDAYGGFQDALDGAIVGDEIWVAVGTYKPSTEVGGSGSRYQTFQMKNGVAIYGGFAGTEDPATFDLADRDFDTNKTILSGDIGVPEDPNDNCFHVFYHPVGTGLDATAVLDGFTITAGNANRSSYPFHTASGGGMFNKRCSPTVTNCTFIDNSAVSTNGGGGGMCNWDNSNPTVTNCTFTGNSVIRSYPVSARRGGRMRNDSSSNRVVSDRGFSGNWAGAGGGAMRNYSSSPAVTNCVFSGNSANDGGGMNNHESSPTLTNCVFSGNVADDRCGGVFNFKSDPIMTNCTLYGNWAYNEGGGVFNFMSSPVMTNCILWGNTASVGNEIYNYPDVARSSRPVVSYCDVGGGWEGVGNIDADPGFVDAGNLRLVSGSPCVDAGYDGMVTEAVDIGGTERIRDGDCDETATVDMGAYELEIACDSPS